MASLRAAVFAALFLFTASLGALAQDVTLTSHDGAVRIDGTLLGFDGDFYRVDTRYGELTIDGSGVICQGPGCPNLAQFVAVFRLSGSALMAEVVMPRLIRAFARDGGYGIREEGDPNDRRLTLIAPEDGRDVARFMLRATTTEEGFADLLADEADAVMSLRQIRPRERQLADEAGLGDLAAPNRSLVVALDGLVPVVAPGNPLREITMTDLSRVLAGEIVNWAALGGADGPIDLYLPPRDSGFVQALEDRLLSPTSRRITARATGVAEPRDIAARVAAAPLAFGIARYAALGGARPLALTGGCGFDIAASHQTIKAEDFPLAAPLYLYLPARRPPAIARSFLAFIRSPRAQLVARRSGLVDQAPEEIPIEMQGGRLANAIRVAGRETTLDELKRMLEVLDGFVRLTLTFRFDPGAATFDAISRSNLQLLARELETGHFDGRRLIVAGFSDGQGPAGPNLDIATRRAASVLEALRAAAGSADLSRLSLEARGFGELMPMACDDTEWGRGVNRRVEIWVR